MKMVDTEHFKGIVEQVERRLPGISMDILFDVGANIGQTTGSMLAHYPNARVFAFEPAPDTFRKLSNSYNCLENVVCRQIAVGAEPGMLPFINVGDSQMNRIAKAPTKKPTIEVEVQTGDDVCRDLNVQHISYLKIDTEGHDLHVLHGFTGMLSKHAIDLIQVEAGLNPTSSTYYVSMEKLKAFLEQSGYRLFYIQKPTFEREARDGVKYSVPFLRYCNLVFVSEVVAINNSVAV